MRWCKPAEGVIKLNVDAAFDQSRGRAGMDGTFRDQEGMFVAGFIQPCFCKTRGNLLHVIMGSQLTSAKQLDQLQAETDCLELVLAIESSAIDWSELGFQLGGRPQS
ncbi:hypothetical protein ACLB2K_022623 [Fragaria x ananassa]